MKKFFQGLTRSFVWTASFMCIGAIVNFILFRHIGFGLLVGCVSSNFINPY